MTTTPAPGRFTEMAKSLLPHRVWYGNDGDEYDRQVERIADFARQAAADATGPLRADLAAAVTLLREARPQIFPIPGKDFGQRIDSFLTTQEAAK